MDALKILSRSTNLGKQLPKAIDSTSSAGETPNPQLFGPAIGNASRKRKRGQAEPGNSTSKEVDIDFFSAPSKNRGRAGADGDTRQSTSQNVRQHEDYPGPVSDGKLDQELPVAERQRMMKEHEIKVMQLWPTKPSTESRSQAKSKRLNGQDTKNSKECDRRRNGSKNANPVIPELLTDFSLLRSKYRIDPVLARNIENQGYSIPTEVQMASIPTLLSQKEHGSQPYHDGLAPDLLTVAPTGSGKTLAFLIPLVNCILQKDKAAVNGLEEAVAPAEAIILAPTKELVNQITNEGRKLLKGTRARITALRKGMRIAGIPRGASDKDLIQSEDLDHDKREPTLSEFENADGDPDSGSDAESEVGENSDESLLSPATKAHILVSTPGLLDQLIMGTILPRTAHIVLDEADVLLDPLFREQTLRIWRACSAAAPHTTLWSATMGSSIEELARDELATHYETHAHTDNSSIRHSLASRRPLQRLVVGLKDSALPHVQHSLVYAATEQGKLLFMRRLLRPTNSSSFTNRSSKALSSTTTSSSFICSEQDTPQPRPPLLVFTQTIPRASALHAELQYDLPSASDGTSRLAVLHAGLSDAARGAIMARFRRGAIWALITTDLLARGVDFRGVNGVVNYDCPSSSAAYVHRAGRTGRAGRKGGVVLTLYAKEDVPYVKGVVNVVAAAKKMENGHTEGDIKSWLLKNLPKPSKRDRQKLKTRGVEERRPGAKGGSKISTKSGWEKRAEDRKRGAVKASLKRARREGMSDAERDTDGDSDSFEGFD